MPRLRRFAEGEDMHEWLPHVRLEKYRMKVLGGPAPPTPHIDRRQDAPVHRYQVRRERDDHLPPGGERKFLVELGHVPVVANAVSVKTLRDFGKEHSLLGGAPR